jgi:hypothetical protein
MPGIKCGPQNDLFSLVGYLLLSQSLLWCLLGRIVKSVKVVFSHPFRVVPGEVTVAMLSFVGYPGFHGKA